MADDHPMNDTFETSGVNTIPPWAHDFYRAIKSKINDQMAGIRISTRAPTPTVQPTPAAPPVPAFTSTIPNEPRREIFLKLPTYHGIKTEFRFWLTQTQAKLNVNLKHFSETNRFWYIHNRLKEKVLKQVEAWVQGMIQFGIFSVKNFIAQLRLVYNNPESREITARKLNDMKQRSKPFSAFISGFEKTMLEIGSLNWGEQIKKTFLSNAINISLQETLVVTPIPTIYIGYYDLFHGVNNNLKALRIKKKREIGGNLPANRSTGSFTGNFTRNSVENTTDEMDWLPTTNVAVSVTTATTKRKTKWVSQKVIDERKVKGACFRCGMAGHKVGNCSFFPPKRPVQAASTTTPTPSTPRIMIEEMDSEKKIGLNRGQKLKPSRNVLKQKWNEF